MFHLEISKSRVNLKEREVLVSGASKSHLVQFAFSSDWEGLNRTAVFRAGEVSRSEVLSHTNQCHIPWEVLEMTGRILWAGVEGTDGEGLVLPTVWCALGCISPGAHPGDDEAQPPTPDVYSQLLAVANKAAETAKSVRDDADAGKFDGADGKDGVDGKDGAPGADGADAPQIDDEAVTGTNPWSSKRILDTLCPAFEVEGNPVTCTPVEGYPLSVQASWEPRQEGEGDPSPDNVRPITGLDSVQVTRCGVNILSLNLSNELIGEVDVNLSDGIVHISGTVHGGNLYFTKQLELPVGTYTFFVYDTDTSTYPNNAIIWVYGDGVATNIILTSGASRAIVNVSDRARIVDVYLHFDPIPSGSEINASIGVSIMAGNQGSASFSPYTGTTATLTLPETIYGGTVDAVTGVGSEEVHGVQFNGTEVWSQAAGGNLGLLYFEYAFPDSADLLPSSAGSVILARQSQKISHFKIGNPYSENVDDAGGVYNTGSAVFAVARIRASRFENVEDWKSYLAAQAAAGTPVTIAYKLATPTQFQATGGQTIPALSGTNTIYTDGDSVTVSGRADSLATIQAMQEQIAALTQHIAEGGTV